MILSLCLRNQLRLRQKSVNVYDIASTWLIDAGICTSENLRMAALCNVSTKMKYYLHVSNRSYCWKWKLYLSHKAPKVEHVYVSVGCIKYVVGGNFEALQSFDERLERQQRCRSMRT